MCSCFYKDLPAHYAITKFKLEIYSVWRYNPRVTRPYAAPKTFSKRLERLSTSSFSCAMIDRMMRESSSLASKRWWSSLHQMPFFEFVVLVWFFHIFLYSHTYIYIFKNFFKNIFAAGKIESRPKYDVSTKSPEVARVSLFLNFCPRPCSFCMWRSWQYRDNWKGCLTKNNLKTWVLRERVVAKEKLGKEGNLDVRWKAALLNKRDCTIFRIQDVIIRKIRQNVFLF